jgi:TonB family protein
VAERSNIKQRGHEVRIFRDWLYVSDEVGVYRYPLKKGELVPTGARETVVADFPKERQRGEQVIASFTVDSSGGVDPASIQIVSSTNDDFANAVVNVLPKWKFTPSTVRGCRVARSIRWEFGEMP